MPKIGFGPGHNNSYFPHFKVEQLHEEEEHPLLQYSGAGGREPGQRVHHEGLKVANIVLDRRLETSIKQLLHILTSKHTHTTELTGFPSNAFLPKSKPGLRQNSFGLNKAFHTNI